MSPDGRATMNIRNVSLARRAWAIRRHALRMAEVQGQGYIGQALGAADLLAVSYFHALNYRADDPEWEGRDRLLLSIGHYAIALYSALIEAGVLPEDEIGTYGMDDSRMPMSGMAAYTPGMEITGGSLGHGLGIAVGVGLGLKAKQNPAFVYNLMSDGELGEGSTWEAAMAAAHHRLGNLICLVDFNNQQADGHSVDMMSSEPVDAKFEAFGWHAQRVDGNDIEALVAAFDTARALRDDRPRVIICGSIKFQQDKLSFFDDYEVTEGAVLRTIETGCDAGSRITSCNCSEHGHKIVVGYKDGLVHVFDLGTQQSVETIKASDKEIDSCQFKGDLDDVIVCIDDAGSLAMWKRQEGGNWSKITQQQCPIGLGLGEKKFQISTDGNYLMGSCHKTRKIEQGEDGDLEDWEHTYDIGLYDISDIPASMLEIKKTRIVTTDNVDDVEFCPGAKGFMLSGLDEVIMWPNFMHETEKVHLKNSGVGHWPGAGQCATYDRNTKSSCLWDMESILSSGADKLSDCKPSMTIPGNLASVHGGRMLAATCHDHRHLSVWDIETQSVLGHLGCEEDKRWHSDSNEGYFLHCLSNDGKWIATCIGGIVTLWNAEHCIRVLEVQVPTHHLDKDTERMLLFTPGGNHLVLVSQSQCLVYDMRVFEGGHEFSVNIPLGYEGEKWQISNDGKKIGAIITPRGSDNRHFWVWIFNDDNTVDLMRQESNGFISAFCFSHDGDKVVSILGTAQLKIWIAEVQRGTIKQNSAGCIELDFPMEHQTSVHGVSFTRNKEGMELVVLLTSKELAWFRLDGSLVCREKLDDQSLGIRHRFSSDGSRCLVWFPGSESRSEVWDLVSCKRVRKLGEGPSTSPLEGMQITSVDNHTLSLTNFEEQVDMNGEHVALGVNQDGEPWWMKPGKTFNRKHLKEWFSCCHCAHGHSNILGPIASVSEDGKHIAMCVAHKKSRFYIAVEPICEDITVHNHGGEVHFCTDEDYGAGRLLMSGNGQRVAWITDHKIRAWDVFCDHRLVPSYHQLKLNNRTASGKAINELLDKYDKNLLNFPDSGGWSLIARAVEDRNTKWVKAILEWAQRDGWRIMLTMDGGEQCAWTDILQLAVDTRYPECVQMLIRATLNKTLGASNREEIFSNALCNIIDVYPMIFKDVICDSSVLQDNGEVSVPHRLFGNRPFLVCTSNKPFAENLEELWTKPRELLLESGLWKMIRCLLFWRKSGMPDEVGLKVPAQSYVIPIDAAAHVGSEGLLKQVLVKGISSQAFNALPLKCLIQYKFDAYGRQLIYDDMCMFALLLLSFTAYSLLLGIGCNAHFDDWFHTSSTVALVLSIILCAHGLFGELKQMITHYKEGHGIGYYWLKSKWNALEFATYALIMLVVPIFHFQGDPCQPHVSTSWTVPVTSILLWWKTLYFAQTFRHTGPMILMIFAIIKDILFFLLVGASVLVGFGVAFFVLYRGDEHNSEVFGTIGRSLLSMFTMMLGDFDLGVFYSSSAPIIAITLFVAYVLVMAVILLNLLIAIMGDSFDRIKEAEEEQFSMVRASILDDKESMLSRFEKNKLRSNIGRFLHVLIPKDHIEEFEEWQGKIAEMEKRFKKMVDETRADLGATIRKVTKASRDKVTAEVEEIVKQRTHRLEDVFKSKVEQLEDFLGKKKK